MDEFHGMVLTGRRAMRVLDRDAEILLDLSDDGTGGSPEVLRGELRQLLLDSLPAGTVRWGHKVSGVRSLGEGRHEVAFNVHPYGARRRRRSRRPRPSRRRPQRTPARP